jgi:YcxB-like protein
MNTINFRFTPTAEDYIAGVKEQFRRQPSNVIFTILSVPFLLGLFALLVLQIAQRREILAASTLPALFIPLLIFSSPWLIYFVVTPLTMRSQVNKNERLRSETFGQADERGVVLRNQHSETRMDWGTFARVIETKTQFLLPMSTNERMYQVIPKRAFDSEQSLIAFQALLMKKSQSGAITRVRQPIGVAAIGWLIPIIVLLLVIAYAVMQFAQTAGKR